MPSSGCCGLRLRRWRRSSPSCGRGWGRTPVIRRGHRRRTARGSPRRSLCGVKSGRKSGRPKGQPGATLEFTDAPDEVLVHETGRCSGCGKGLAGALACPIRPDASYRDIGPGFYDTRPGRQHRERDLIHLTGQHVTLQPKPGEHAAAA